MVSMGSRRKKRDDSEQMYEYNIVNVFRSNSLMEMVTGSSFVSTFMISRNSHQTNAWLIYEENSISKNKNIFNNFTATSNCTYILKHKAML